MKVKTLAAALPLALFVASGAAAQDAKISGSITYFDTGQEVKKLEDGRTAINSSSRGVTRSDDPGSVFNLNTQDCTILLILAPDGKGFTGGGACRSMDRD